MVRGDIVKTLCLKARFGCITREALFPRAQCLGWYSDRIAGKKHQKEYFLSSS